MANLGSFLPSPVMPYEISRAKMPAKVIVGEDGRAPDSAPV
jgi:hypothetical protein